MSTRVATRLAWSLWALYAVLQGATGWLVWSGAPGSADYLIGLMMIGFATVGALVASRRRANAIGWLLVASSLAVAVQMFGEAYSATPTYPGRIAVAWVHEWIQLVWLVLIGIFIPLLFPDGHLPSPRWRPVAWIGAVALATGVVGAAFEPDELFRTGIQNPLGARGALADLLSALATASGWLGTVGFLLAGMSLIVRLRGSSGVERQQLKWFAFVGLVMLGGLALAAIAEFVPGGWVELLGGVGWSTFLFGFIIGIPAATGIAILRHRLYDIDLVINRTLVYGSLTATLAATYLLLVLVLQLVLDPLTGQSDLAVAGSTLAAATLVRPLRARIQKVVDRRFYRQRYDASRTLEAFSGRLRDELDLETVGADLRRVVQATVQPVHVSLWLREASR